MSAGGMGRDPAKQLLRAGIIILALALAIAMVHAARADTAPPGAAYADAAASPGTALVDAIRTGNRDAALALIRHGADVNAGYPDGSTPLLWAVYTVDVDMAKRLLDRGARAGAANAFGATPLTEAVKAGNLDLVKLLLKHKANADAANADGQTALMLAAHTGLVPIAQALVSHGAAVNAVERLRGQTALMWAAADNHPEMVAFLLQHGAKPDVRADVDDWQNNVTSEPRAQYRPSAGLTALLYATRSGCLECVQSLLKAGADIDEPTPDGITPLMSAIDNLNFSVAKLLLEKGANPNTWDWWGRTPLYVAVDMDSFVNRAVGGLTTAGGAFGPEPQGNANDPLHARDIINMLLADGVDVNTQLHMHRPGRGGNSGRFTDDLLTVGATPLLRAAISYDVDVVKLLLAHGARVDLPNGMGVTPLMAAAGIGRGFHIPIPGRRGLHSGGDALEDRQIATLDTLLEAGADINARITDTSSHTARIARASSMTNRQGQTALYGAISIGSLRVAQYLLDHGARADVADAAGRTPLDATQARAGGRDTPASPEMVALIRKAYAAGGAPPPVAANSPGTAPRALPRGPADPRGN